MKYFFSICLLLIMAGGLITIASMVEPPPQKRILIRGVSQ